MIIEHQDITMTKEQLADKLTALEESEMILFRFLKDHLAGAILTADTDIMIAKLLSAAGLADFDEETNKAIVPADIREGYSELWSDEMALQWRKRGWMYKCIESGKYRYGIMTWEVLQKLIALIYTDAQIDEVKALFFATPEPLQGFAERKGRLVLNCFEKEDYYIYLEQRVQKGVPYYIPTKDEVEELYDQGCLISREAHAKLQDFITDTFGCGRDIAALRIHELYESVNRRVRVNDAVDEFASGEAYGTDFSFPSDEIQFRFVELFIEMSRECRIRDNRGHDYYEMVGIMASRNAESRSGEDPAPVKRVKIGRNDPCPCGSGKKYKNCCGRN